jgi:hypothetical protein
MSATCPGRLSVGTRVCAEDISSEKLPFQLTSPALTDPPSSSRLNNRPQMWRDDLGRVWY